MDKKEFSMFAMAMKTYYSREKIIPTPQAMDLWYMQLKDIPFKAAEEFLANWVSNNNWSPSIADIKHGVAKTATQYDTWEDAWEQVRLAIRKYGSYGELEALESMEPITRECVKNIGYFNLCMSENISIERATFRDIYKAKVERKKEDSMIPQNFAKLMTETIERLEEK